MKPPPLGIAALLFLAACGSDLPKAPMGVLLISVDSLRADHLSSYGYESVTAPGVLTSPHIDARLAAEGTLFEEFISTTSWTVPAHMAMLSGQPDRIHGVLEPASRLPEGRRLLAESFADAGWSTAGFYSGPNLHPWFGFGRGFDRYVDCTSMGVDEGKFKASRKELRAMEDASHRGNTGELVDARFGEWFDELDSDQRFFGFVHLWDAHYDYEPPAEFDLFDPDYTGNLRGTDVPQLKLGQISDADAAHVVALYDGEIRYVDHTVNRILDRLQAAGRLDNTLVIFTADHGEEFGEHGRFGHNKTLFDEVVHIPLIVRWPGHVKAGLRIGEQVSLVDLAPTLLEMADLPLNGTEYGSSFASAFVEDGDFAARLAPMELAFGRPDPAQKRAAMEGLRAGGYKVLRNRPGERLVVLNLDSDPGELQPFEVPAEDVRLMRARDLWKQIRERGAMLSRETGVMPGNLEKGLKDVGYLGSDE